MLSYNDECKSHTLIADVRHTVSVYSAMQAVAYQATKRGRPLTTFSPAVLRQALRRAGNILKPEEVDAVLLYALKDNQLADLDQLYLVSTFDGCLKQLRCSPNPFSAQQQRMQTQFFMWRDPFSKDLYHLLDNNHQKVLESQAWRSIAR